jgi:peptidyl-tRNA hydrolase, PTH1 family
MNESGSAVAPLARYFHVESEHLIVVHDDIDVPFGKLKVQFGGGSGGHNGVASVVASFGREDFWRLKCGVGRPPGAVDPADHVLRRFTSGESEDAELMRRLAADVVELFATDGGEVARQRAGELNAS